MKIHTKIITAAILITGLGSGSYYTYTEFDKLKNENNDLHKQVSNLSDLVVNKDKLIDKYLKANEQLESNNQKLSNQVKAQGEEIEGLNQTIKNKNTSIHNLKQQLEKATKKNESPRSQVSRGVSSSNGRVLNIEATAYGADCKGCSGITASGYDVRNTIYYQGLRVVAMDTAIVQMYSIILVQTETEIFKAIVLDRGSDIKGYRLDLLTESEEASKSFGRQKVKVTVIREGK